jgi:hypothetical protein
LPQEVDNFTELDSIRTQNLLVAPYLLAPYKGCSAQVGCTPSHEKKPQKTSLGAIDLLRAVKVFLVEKLVAPLIAAPNGEMHK